ncbi:hypothetical protein M3Y97_00935500 [Aphelenchoides bicaudatus]|nr:hypothetical protein M3Y97_00935500 [Aphelenchoides bicaudatus]
MLGLLLVTGFILRVYLMPTQGKPKNAYFMLYHGTIYIAGGQMVTISVFFLAFDRIVGMIAPAIHRKHQLNLVVTTLTFVFIGFFFNVITVLIYQPVPPAPITLCDTIVCAQGKDAADIIYGTGICITTSTVCVGVVFNIILYRYWNTYNEGETTKAQFRRANYFVLVACLSEIFLRFIPQVLNYATFNIDPKWATFFAFLVTTSISADSAITAAFYRYMILKRVNEPKTRVVLLNSKTSAQQTMYTQTNQTS